jgi:hypothetical protein
MLGEKEEISRIKKSLKAGRRPEDITKKLMARGYKYEYAAGLVSKAGRGRKVMWGLLVFVVAVVLLGWGVYGNFFKVKDIELNVSNPLAGIRVLNTMNDSSEILQEGNQTEATNEIEISDIEITTDFVEYLLSAINAQNYLHAVPFTNNVPVINFIVGEKEFSAIIENDIQASEELSADADLEFEIPSEVVVLTTLAEDPREEFLGAVEEGEVQIETLAGETELLAKGYLGFYDSLTSD